MQTIEHIKPLKHFEQKLKSTTFNQFKMFFLYKIQPFELIEPLKPFEQTFFQTPIMF